MKYVVRLRYIPHAPPFTVDVEGCIFDYIEEKYLALVSRYPDKTLTEFEYEDNYRLRHFKWFADEDTAKNNNWTDGYKYIGAVK